MKYFIIKDKGIYWSPYKWKDDIEYRYYLYPFPNWLPEQCRYIGYEEIYYDGYHYTFGFWYFNIYWNFGLADIKHWIKRN